jgi:hypothetical protein
LRGDDVSIVRNLVDRSSVNGISILAPSNRIAIDRNQIREGGGDGILLDGSDHDVTSNLSNSNGGAGFHALSSSSLIRFEKNTSNSNATGFEDDSVGTGTAGTSNTYVSNRCARNAVKSIPARLCQ